MSTSLPKLDFKQPLDLLFEHSPLKNSLENCDNPAARWLGQALAEVWFEFNEKLSTIDIVKAFENETVTRDQYLSYLRNMRQQVSQGARWITRAASSMENSHVQLRNALISHAKEEHQDFHMLEQDYIKSGGQLEDILNAPMNIGSQALSCFIMSEASQRNPAGIFGATFIIEGLGFNKASLWAEGIKSSLNCPTEHVSFLHYHGENDPDHYENLIKVLSSPFINEETAPEARRIAKIVGRLYALQLEELDNY